MSKDNKPQENKIQQKNKDDTKKSSLPKPEKELVLTTGEEKIAKESFPAESSSETGQKNICNKINLPDQMPEKWLTQIKEKLRDSAGKIILTAILGSSLLSTVFTSFANWYIENHKSQLVVKLDQVKEKLNTYKLLAESIAELEKNARSSQILLVAATKNPSQTERSKEAVISLANQIAVVQDRKNKIDISKETQQLVLDTLDPLGTRIQSSQTNPDNNTFTDLAQTLKTLIEEGIPKINNKIASDKEQVLLKME